MKNFSIIIPVFNEEKNIEDLIDEINLCLKKYYDLFEIIIVDDGSKDNSLNVIKNIQKNHPVKLLEHNKNLGQSRSIYTGIQNSSAIVLL